MVNTWISLHGSHCRADRDSFDGLAAGPAAATVRPALAVEFAPIRHVGWVSSNNATQLVGRQSAPVLEPRALFSVADER
jgi:hypothetical protein